VGDLPVTTTNLVMFAVCVPTILTLGTIDASRRDATADD
jgi:hypothetical protein